MLKHIDQGKQVDVLILNFSKAFDTVPHRCLLGKLEHYGVRNNLLRWCESFFVGRFQSVLVDGVKSAEESVLSGVPQGTVLGPLMFLLYINDLPSRLNSDTRCRLFADDCLLYRIIDGLEDQVQLQSDLRELEQWAAVQTGACSLTPPSVMYCQPISDLIIINISMNSVVLC